jgi:ribonucleotide monophosphatase NagD (HAD superfamily)
MIEVGEDEKLVVIGDNPWTDIELSKNLECQSILISSKSDLVKNSPSPTFSVKSLKEIL